MTRVDKPVTYKLFPGFSTLESRLLDRLRDSDLETDLLYRLYGEGEREYLDALEYDITSNRRRHNPIDDRSLSLQLS